MTDQYFWAEEVKDKDIDPDSNPAEYFAIMKYPEDRWSRIMNTKGLGEIADARAMMPVLVYNLTFWEKVGYHICRCKLRLSEFSCRESGVETRGPDYPHERGKNDDGKLHELILRYPIIHRAFK